MPRKLINSTYITLDGMVEDPQLWPTFGRESDDRAGTIQTELALSCDALVMGRHTYEGFAPVWPTLAGNPLADHINAMRKYVVSTRLRDPAWANTHVIGEDVAATVARLKEAPGQDLLQYGIGPLTRLLLEHGLLDELRLWIHPLVLGEPRPRELPFGGAPTAGFELTDVTTLSSGIVILSYAAA